MELRHHDFKGKRALLADDEEGVRLVLRLLLEHLGLEVTEAVDGEEALACYQNAKFDFVVTDYNMPKKRGDTLAQEIKLLNPHQRVVMISGYAGRMLQNGKLPACIDKLVCKPCTMEELADALE
jgi:two-component system chemotaxis response regulator CheY